MKVLQITHYMAPHAGGIELVGGALAAGLRARGHEVHWMAAAPPLPPGEDPGATRVAAWNVLEDWLGLPYPLWRPAHRAQVARRVAWADVVLAHDCLYMGTSAAVAACRRAGRPLLLMQHVAMAPFNPLLVAAQWLAYRTLGLRNLAAADARVVCSAHVADWFRGLGCRAPFEVLPNSVGLDRFAPATPARRAAARRALGLEEAGPVVACVGRLVVNKGIQRALAVQRALAPEGVRLLLVGDGPLRARLAGVPGLHHLAAVPPERMADVYAAADVFLLPSRGEGLSLALQEALRSGLGAVVSEIPSFTTNLAGAPGVVIGRDDAALVAGVRALLARPPDARVVAAWAEARWSDTRFLDAHEAALRRLVERRAPAGSTA